MVGSGPRSRGGRGLGLFIVTRCRCVRRVVIGHGVGRGDRLGGRGRVRFRCGFVDRGRSLRLDRCVLDRGDRFDRGVLDRGGGRLGGGRLGLDDRARLGGRGGLGLGLGGGCVRLATSAMAASAVPSVESEMDAGSADASVASAMVAGSSTTCVATA